jgi:Methyltransferase domain
LNRNPDISRIDVIRAALSAVEGRSYLEIGVRRGECFHEIEAETKVGVDPEFTFRPPIRASLRKLLRRRTGAFYFRMTSDAFFTGPARRFPPFDVVLVDGLHTYAQSYVDILNAVRVLDEHGIVVVHDCNPASAAAAAPTLEEAMETPGFNGDWNGDVYKALIRIRTHGDLRASVIDSDQGLGIVRRGAAEARLELASVEIERLGYEDFSLDRVRLLGLRAPDRLAATLAEAT